MRFLATKKILFFFFLIILSGSKLLGQDSLITQNDLIKKEGIINIQQDSRIERLIAIKKRIVDDKRYRIQIYNGNNEGARKVESQFKSQFRDWSCDVSFETPNFKVRVGKFRTRLEADKYLIEIKKKYPSAFILAP